MSAASDNLRTNQEQCDADGCYVKVSRQALDEVLAEYDAQREALAAVDELWTIDAGLGFSEEMNPPSPVGIVWTKVRACCNGK